MEVIMLSGPSSWKKFDYVINEPPASMDSKYADWRVEDAQLGVSCGIVWSLRLVVVWFSYW